MADQGDEQGWDKGLISKVRDKSWYSKGRTKKSGEGVAFVGWKDCIVRTWQGVPGSRRQAHQARARVALESRWQTKEEGEVREARAQPTRPRRRARGA
jgi:hypothetical protein